MAVSVETSLSFGLVLAGPSPACLTASDGASGLLIKWTWRSQKMLLEDDC